MFVLPFMLNFLQDVLHIPGIIKYTVDLAWIITISFIVIARQQFIHKKVLPLLAIIGIYLLYVLIVYMFNFQSVFYFIWGLRNNIRYYIAVIAFVYFLDKDDIELCLKLIDILFVIHVIAAFVQFFILGYDWDYLGGIFGVQRGCNGHSLLFIAIVCIKSLLMYMHGRERLITCLMKCVLSLVIAVMSELKFMFILFMIILVITVVNTRFSFKKLLLVAGASVISFLGAMYFTTIWGENYALTIDRIIELVTSTHYSSTRDLSRFTAIPVISETILTDVPQKLFGLGLGNCETSSFAICNTPFYESHSYLNYNWISSAFAFIETGFIGLALLVSFFVVVFFCAGRMKRRGECPDLYAEMSMTMSIVCIIMLFYNSSLRTDIGYIAYFILAIPFISSESESIFQMFSRESKQVYDRSGE